MTDNLKIDHREFTSAKKLREAQNQFGLQTCFECGGKTNNGICSDFTCDKQVIPKVRKPSRIGGEGWGSM